MRGWATGRGVGSQEFFNQWVARPKTGLDDDVPEWFEFERDMLDATAEVVELLAHGRIVGAHHIDKRIGEEDLIWPRLYLAIGKEERRAAERAKVLARSVTTSAIASRRLVRLCCEVCGVERTEAHHHDYEKPLEVRWLCRQHHDWLHHRGYTIAEMQSFEQVAA